MLRIDAVLKAVAQVRRSGAYRGALLSFEFLVLTVARSAEVRGVTWDEIDLKAAVWTIRGRADEGRPRARSAAVEPARSPSSTRTAENCPKRATSCFRQRKAACQATIGWEG